jgi:uncharacterized membrane protein
LPGVVVAAGVLVLLGGLVFYFWTRSELWLDEALSVNIADLPLRDLHAALKQDGAPPLYYVLLHGWTAVFGTGNEAARSLSAVFMIGAVVCIFFAAQRFAGRTAAWIAVILLAVNPYAIRYATEARMYSLVALLVAGGTLVAQRAIEKPSFGRVAPYAVLVALAFYTQYWCFYIVGVAGLLFIWMWWRTKHREAGRNLLLATIVGGLAFLPWVPTFLYQREHTGTPWGKAVMPGIPIGYTLRDFAGGASGTAADRQEGWVLFFILVPMLLLGIFAVVSTKRTIELDVLVPKVTRGVTYMLVGGLVIATTLNYFASGAFQSRYSAIVFPFYILLVARGFTLLRDQRVLGALLILTVVLGFAGGVRNARTQRTQAGAVAAVLNAQAQRGDLVVYCPDQIAPSVHRLLKPGLEEVVYPSFDGPEIIDWVDYKARLARANVNEFAAEATRRAGDGRIWYVSAPGYITHPGTCEELSNVLAADRDRRQLTVSDEQIFEKPALQLFTVR